jgi:D-alanyl-D-alanine carboxypeptidase (penicillin-binding protein 5/6)
LHPKADLQAPIREGDQVGTLSVTAPDFPGLTVPVYAAQDVPRASIFSRMAASIQALFKGKK